MSDWYTAVSNNIAKLPECIEFFEGEIVEARKDIALAGSIEKASAKLPSVVESGIIQSQEIEGILEYLNIELRKVRAETFKKYLESYNRQLSSRDAQFYVDGESEVVDLQKLINEFSLLRNKFLGLMKGLDAKQFQVNNIVKLRVAGLEDSEINFFKNY